MGLEPGGYVGKPYSLDGLVTEMEGNLGSKFAGGKEGRLLGRNGGDREQEWA